MKSKDVRKRLTGLSVEGVQWEYVETAHSAAFRVLSFLGDRRVLFNPYWQEQTGECVSSVIDVRTMLGSEIGNANRDARLIEHLSAMRAACRRFLDQVSAVYPDANELWVPFHQLSDRDTRLAAALGELRAAMGIQIGLIAAGFDLEVPETLVEILPALPDDGADMDRKFRRRGR